MATKNNPVLGYVECQGCGGRCSVHQTTRGAGRFLYTRCGGCGVDQRTGPAVQSRLWWGAVWLDGPPEIRPPGVAESGPEPEPEPKPEPEPEPLGIEETAGGGWILAIGGAVALVCVSMLRGGR